MGRASHHSYTTIPARQVYMSHKTVREIFPYLAVIGQAFGGKGQGFLIVHP